MFGMGTGVAPPLWSPGIFNHQQSAISKNSENESLTEGLLLMYAHCGGWIACQRDSLWSAIRQAKRGLRTAYR